MRTTSSEQRRVEELETEVSRLKAELTLVRGEAPLLQLLLDDIALRRRVEDQLREAQEWLQLAQAAGPVAAYTFDLATRRMVWSPASNRLYGFAPGLELTLERWIDAIHPEDRAQALAALDAAERRGAPIDRRYRIVRPDGEIRCVQDRAQLKLDDGGAPARIVGVNIDVTSEHRREAEIRWTDAQLRALIEATSAVSWTTDADGLVREPSPSWQEFTGQAAAEFSGLGWIDAVHPEDRAKAREAWLEATARRIPYDVEYRLRTRAGGYRLTHARGVPVLSPTGEIGGWIGANVDVTDRRAAEQRLLDREERLRAALAGSSAGTFRWDIRTDSLDWDVELDRLFGLPPGETARSLEAFVSKVHPDDQARVIALCGRCRDEGADFEDTFRVVRPNGEIRWIYDRGRTYRDAEDRPAYMTGACIDVTERIAAVRRLERSEEHLRLAQDIGEIGTYEWRPDTDEILTTGAYSRIFGVEPGRFTRAAEFVDLIHPEDRTRSYALQVHAGPELDDYIEVRIRRASDGQERLIARRGKVFRDRHGRPERAVGAIYDVTESRRTENRLNAVLESVSDGFVGVDPDWRITVVNGAAERQFGVQGDVIGRDFRDVFADRLDTGARRLLEEAMTRQVPAVFELTLGERPARILEVRIAPKRGGGIALSSTDATARREAERLRDLLVGELDHRVKNTLAVVQSMARHTFRDDGDGASRLESFERRLQALAGAQSMVSDQRWEAAFIGDIVEAALRPFSHFGPDRISRTGPETRLPARYAMTLVLALHELATNAVKYGALSTEAGRVRIDWRVVRAATGARLAFTWREVDGPEVRRPTRSGFGSRLIRSALPSEADADVELRYDPGGVVFNLSTALSYLPTDPPTP